MSKGLLEPINKGADMDAFTWMFHIIICIALIVLGAGWQYSYQKHKNCVSDFLASSVVWLVGTVIVGLIVFFIITYSFFG